MTILYITHVPKTAERWSGGRKGPEEKGRAGRRLFQFIKIIVPSTIHFLLKTKIPLSL